MMVIFEYTLSSFHANKKRERGKRLPNTCGIEEKGTRVCP